MEDTGSKINWNGSPQASEQASALAANRAFRYGDGLFESIRAFEGRLPFVERHWQRLQAGMGALRMDIPAHYGAEYFRQQILQLIENQGNWRIRLTVWRSGGGLYLPAQNAPEFLLEATPWPSGQFELNEKGLRLGIFKDVRLSHSIISTYKTCNALPSVLAAQHRQSLGYDESLLLNRSGRIACGAAANFFCVKNGGLLTPSLREGCVAGTMRGLVMEAAAELGIPVTEQPIPLKNLPEMEGVFLTNAVLGIRWAASVGMGWSRNRPEVVENLVERLNKKIGISSKR